MIEVNPYIQHNEAGLTTVGNEFQSGELETKIREVKRIVVSILKINRLFR